MELYFLRHALAAQRDSIKYKDDTKRPLTAEGEQKMQRCAHGMQALGLTFDTILCSPYVRARQTAEIVARVFKLKKTILHLTNNLIPDAPFEKLVLEVRTDFPDSKNLLFVGHQPHLADLISYILNTEKPIPFDLKKSGLCHLSQLPAIGQDNAVFNWLLTPSQLCLMVPGSSKKGL
ncbi:MAG: phosphohistidine phosphatase SixA [Candidatus Omnitrophica bacterium]|nr:phosphohistidine phosphatase SixA [Candidatus Omnitrophota bacterium]